MDQIKLEGMVVLWLRYSCDGIGNRAQRVVQRRRLDDFAFRLQGIENLLAHLNFIILVFVLLCEWCGDGARHRETEQRNSVKERRPKPVTPHPTDIISGGFIP